MTTYNSGLYNTGLVYNAGVPLLELPVVNADIYINKGSTFAKNFIVKDEVGNPLNLSNMTVEASLRRYFNDDSYIVSMPASIGGDLTGKITITLSDIETAKLINNRYVYEIRLFDNYMKIKVFHGQALVESTC